VEESAVSAGQISCEVDAEVLENLRYGEYARHVIAGYEELQVVLAGLEAAH
jgi:hypothetical protein